jgi:hypothetical protein
VALHNLADRPARVSVALDTDSGEQLRDLLGRDGGGDDRPRQPLELPPFGYRWLRVVGGKWRSR